MKAILLSPRNPIHRPSLQHGFLLVPLSLMLVCFALCQTAQAVTPAPDGGYANYNTAEGSNALFHLTSGSYNTAVGFQSLASNTSGGYNTALGLNALYYNTTSNYNTAVGFEALFRNTTGTQNTATGVNALINNNSGIYNTADGVNALYHNTTGANNTAMGVQALSGNTSGSGNIAVGRNAGLNLTVGNNNIDIGSVGVAGESGIIRIGTDGVHTNTVLTGVVQAEGVKQLAGGGTPNLSIGTFGGSHLELDNNEIQAGSGNPASNNPSTLFLNFSGGDVEVGGPGSVTSVIGTMSNLDIDGTSNAGSGAGVTGATAYLQSVLSVRDNQLTNGSVLSLHIGDVNGNTGNNYVTFFDGDGDNEGAIESNGTNAVLATSGADFAERLPKADPDQVFAPAQIVALKDGKVHPAGIANPDQFMVISTAPIVCGGTKGRDPVIRAKSEQIGFIGQVPVQVRGPVKSGDFILASEKGDGTGLAMSPANVPASAMHRVVGRAWETSTEEGLKTVNAIVGRDQTSLVLPALKRLERENGELRAIAKQQQKEVQVLTAQLREQAAQIQKVSARLELNKAGPKTVAND